MSDITVVIPTIPGREALLDRAMRSVLAQDLPPAAALVVPDTHGHGAPRTRHAGLEAVTTRWVAFLDDDDEFKPEHLAALRAAADEQGADYVFSWYDVVGGTDPRASEFGLPWDPEHPRQTTITTLVNTALAQEVGGFLDEADDLSEPGRRFAGEDWLFTLRVNAAGGRIFHLPQRTWRWHHHGGNTSGLPQNRPTAARSSEAALDSRGRRRRRPRR